MRKQYFEGNTYKTQIKNRGWLKKSRFIFILRFFGIVIRSRRLALDGKFNMDEFSRSSFDIFRMLEDSGAVFNIEGFDNIRSLDEPVIFISNHMSTMETQIFPCLIVPFMDVTFVVKESLVNFPFFGPIMRSRDPIVVSRKNSREDLLVVMREGATILSSGKSIIIFPQSTRKEYFNPSEFNSLGVKLAEKTGVRVVPLAIKTDYWKNGKMIKDLGPLDRKQQVHIEIGRPISAEKAKSAHKEVLDFILPRLKKWGVEVMD